VADANVGGNVTIEDLGPAGAMVLARHEGRRFPGLLIQGDMLLTLLEDLREEAPLAVATTRVTEWLAGYEAALDVLGHPLPYPAAQRVS
jgi:hypothetical protein